MIDLNNPKYISEKLTKEILLKKFSEEKIFEHYVGDFELGVPMKSPIRSGDDTPSFNIFYSKRHDCLLFKDFAGKRGDCVKLVQELLGISSYQKALEQIDKDISFNGGTIKKAEDKGRSLKSKTSCIISIVTKPWDVKELDYWRGYGITGPTLRMYNVYPIEGYYHNGYYIDTPDLAFAYLEYKDNQLTYKIYRPKANKYAKWRNNNPYGVHQGYMQLPPSGDLLIITKSLKDVMALYENADYAAVGVQSETCFMKDTVVEEYKSRFTKVVTLFDNDRQGKEQAEQYKKLYNLDPIFIPEKYIVKDFSDLIQMVGKGNAVETLKTLL
jgi:hypothetical protein